MSKEITISNYIIYFVFIGIFTLFSTELSISALDFTGEIISDTTPLGLREKTFRIDFYEFKFWLIIKNFIMLWVFTIIIYAIEIKK